MDKENKKPNLNYRMKLRSMSVDTRENVNVVAEKKTTENTGKGADPKLEAVPKVIIPNLTANEIKLIQKSITNASQKELEVKVDALTIAVNDIADLQKQMLADIKKQFDLGSITMQTALGMLLDRFKMVEEKMCQSSGQFFDFKNDWFRKNAGIKRALDTLQSLLRATNNSQIVGKIAARVEENDERLVNVLFKMFRQILDANDAAAAGIEQISKAVKHDWGLLVNIEDLRKDFVHILNLFEKKFVNQMVSVK